MWPTDAWSLFERNDGGRQVAMTYAMVLLSGSHSTGAAWDIADTWGKKLAGPDAVEALRPTGFIGDVREKGTSGPDRRVDHSGHPLYLFFFPLPELQSHQLSGLNGDSDTRLWILRKTFFLEKSPRHDDEAAWLQIVMMNVPPEAEDEFNDWYEKEHATRIAAGAPEFVAVSRFHALAGSPRHVAFWRLSDPTAPERDPWLSASETPWTLRVRHFMRDRCRLIFTPLLERT